MVHVYKHHVAGRRSDMHLRVVNSSCAAMPLAECAGCSPLCTAWHSHHASDLSFLGPTAHMHCSAWGEVHTGTVRQGLGAQSNCGMAVCCAGVIANWSSATPQSCHFQSTLQLRQLKPQREVMPHPAAMAAASVSKLIAFLPGIASAMQPASTA